MHASFGYTGPGDAHRHLAKQGLLNEKHPLKGEGMAAWIRSPSAGRGNVFLHL